MELLRLKISTLPVPVSKQDEPIGILVAVSFALAMSDFDWLKHRTDLLTGYVRWVASLISIVLAMIFGPTIGKLWEQGAIPWWTVVVAFVTLAVPIAAFWIHGYFRGKTKPKPQTIIPRSEVSDPPPYKPRLFENPQPEPKPWERHGVSTHVLPVNTTPQRCHVIHLPMNHGERLWTFQCNVELRCEFVRIGLKLMQADGEPFGPSMILQDDGSTMFQVTKEPKDPILRSAFYQGLRRLNNSNYTENLRDKNKRFTISAKVQQGRPNTMGFFVNEHQVFVKEVHPDFRYKAALLVWGEDRTQPPWANNYYEMIIDRIGYTVEH